jgi:nucleoid-associated protein YgaU
VWASLNFTAVIKQVNQKFTMFNKDGKPVRATLTVTFNEYRTTLSDKEKKLESGDRTKVYTLKQGDSLWQIAGDEYGDPVLWRPIAKTNKIVNPRVLEVGMQIVIPPLE